MANSLHSNQDLLAVNNVIVLADSLDDLERPLSSDEENLLEDIE